MKFNEYVSTFQLSAAGVTQLACHAYVCLCCL